MDDIRIIHDEGMWAHIPLPALIIAKLKRALTKKPREVGGLDAPDATQHSLDLTQGTGVQCALVCLILVADDTQCHVP